MSGELQTDRELKITIDTDKVYMGFLIGLKAFTVEHGCNEHGYNEFVAKRTTIVDFFGPNCLLSGVYTSENGMQKDKNEKFIFTKSAERRDF